MIHLHIGQTHGACTIPAKTDATKSICLSRSYETYKYFQTLRRSVLNTAQFTTYRRNLPVNRFQARAKKTEPSYHNHPSILSTFKATKTGSRVDFLRLTAVHSIYMLILFCEAE